MKGSSLCFYKATNGSSLKKKKGRKREAKGKKKKKPFQPLLFKGSYMGFAFLLISLFPLFKAGVKFRGRNLGLEKVMELLGIHPKNGSRSKAQLGEGSALWGFAGRRELLLSGNPKTSALSGTCTLKRNLRRQSFISWDLRNFIKFFSFSVKGLLERNPRNHCPNEGKPEGREFCRLSII